MYRLLRTDCNHFESHAAHYGRLLSILRNTLFVVISISAVAILAAGAARFDSEAKSTKAAEIFQRLIAKRQLIELSLVITALVVYAREGFINERENAPVDHTGHKWLCPLP
ncbi:hypothetical protein BJ741DRAFT_672826 [Chytriomyces cf. hyalinus JEL632]|nr:hypothetical protein BJ741DRAFT_672826 [Chytriomyces cf. hyalinus JEL632]